MAVLTHGLTKEQAIDPTDIQRALDRRALFEADPKAHTLTLALTP